MDHLIKFLLGFSQHLRTDVVAHYKPPVGDAKRGTYAPVRAPLTEADLHAHLSGKQPLGLYIFKEAHGVKGLVNAACVDLDDKKHEHTFAAICDHADTISRMLAQRGLMTWPVRSGSGHGVHLWLFWEQAQEAKKLRIILKDIVEKAKVPLHIDLFPAGDHLQEGQLGNLVAIPLGRASRPLAMADNKWVAVEELEKWLPASLPLSTGLVGARGLDPDSVKADAGRGARGEGYGPVDVPTLAEALSFIPNSDYKQWMRLGMALKRAAYDGQLTEEGAEQAWLDWSRPAPNFDEREAGYQWRRFRPDGSLNLGVVWNLAAEGGWKPTAQDLRRPAESRQAVRAKVERKMEYKMPENRAEAAAMRRLPWLVAGGPEHTAELNTDHFLSMEGGRAFIFKEGYDPIFKRQKLTRMLPPDFKLLVKNQKVEVGQTKKGVPIMEDLGTAWLDDPYRRQYDEIVLMPEGCEPWKYNLWRGWTCEAKQDGDCSLFLAHLRDNLCSGVAECYEYLLNWLALTLQRPYEAIGVAVVLRGEKGTGKGTFATLFGSLIGQHFLHIIRSSDLTGRFNSHLQDCVVMFADEAVWAGSKTEVTTLNGLITEPTIFIEGKGRDGYESRNMLHLIIATESDWSVPAGLDERRYFAVKVSNDHKQDLPYFKAIKRQFYEEGGKEKFLWLLLNRDISKFMPQQMPKTEELMEQKIKSLDPFMEWWHEKLLDGALLESYPGAWDAPVVVQALYFDYVWRCRLAGHRYTGGQRAFISKLRGILPAEPGVSRGRLPEALQIGPETLMAGSLQTWYRLPLLAACRALFDKRAGSKRPWAEPEVREPGAAGRGPRAGDDAKLL